MKPILTDIETAPVDGVMDYFDASVLDEVHAPANYKDETKIAEYIAAKKLQIIADHVAKAALDPDLCRIVALGWWADDAEEPTSLVCLDEDEERAALELFWIARTDRHIAGFNVAAFDVPVIYRRSLYLGVRTPPMRRGKWAYQNPEISDVFLTLNEDGRLPWRGVSFYAKRFGIAVPHDPFSGEDVPRLVAEGRWGDVRHHNLVDLVVERGIAARLGVMSPSRFTLPSLADSEPAVAAGERTAAGS